MSWIEEIGIEEASEELREAFRRVADERGCIANVFRAESLNPGALEKHIALYEQVMSGPSGLSPADRESIAVVVSAANNCGYCVTDHAEALSHYETENSRLRRMVTDFRFLDEPDDKARMLSYALKLTTSPSQVGEEDIRELRGLGFSDRDILDMNLITAYFNFVCRVSLGLGVSHSEDEAEPTLPGAANR